MRDGIALARQNKPTVALVTRTFEEQGTFVARSAGMPDIPRVILPHPVAGTGKTRMGEIAESVADEICARLRGLT